VGSRNTTIECPPKLSGFLGRLTIALAGLTTGTATASDPAGNFCPSQAHPGAFGGEAGTIRETGSPAARDLSNPFESTIAGTFCVPSTGNPVIDGGGDLPGPGAMSARHDDRDPASALRHRASRRAQETAAHGHRPRDGELAGAGRVALAGRHHAADGP